MNKRKRSPDETPAGPNTLNLNTSPVAAGELNESLPPISRKITACAACRKQKIRCDMPDGVPPCMRCRRRELSCVLNRSLQSLIEEAKNTDLLQADVREIHSTLGAICEHLGLDRPKPLHSSHNHNSNDMSAPGAEVSGSQAPPSTTDNNDQDQTLPGCEVSPPGTPSAVQAPIDTYLDIAKLGSNSHSRSPGSGSGSAETPSNQVSRPRRHASPDLVSKGIISMADAETLVDRYFTRVDSYLYGIGSRLHNLQRLRTGHPVLFAAICTVSALHDPGDQSLYESCNREFRRLVSQSLFEKHDLEYIRALCISSFWLADASRILLSDAIRRSADVHLHRSFGRLWSCAGDARSNPAVAEMRDRIRLWYLLFICDQHLSILHNRDPLLRSDTEIAISWEAYLRCSDVTDSDVRIVSQVALLLIMSQVRDVLGCDSDTETRIPQTLANQIVHYSRQLDKWFKRFSSMFKPDPSLGDFPRRGLQLHYQFGKLYLGHQVFKGLRGEAIPGPFMAAASMAHDAAISIFEMILDEETLQANLVGMPHYFHIMLAFAGHFLLEVTKGYAGQLGIVPDDNFMLIRKVLTLFRGTRCVAMHPICRMTPGLERKLGDCAASLVSSPTQVSPVAVSGVTKGAVENVAEGFVWPGDGLFGTAAGTGTGTADEVFLPEWDFGEFSFPGMLSNIMP
ncbi:hypothetical protein SI65_09399 [Aspergillus cristatus]|uniref:Zn(2)-C6 fungal-type domain-containing protein n=1 Tax=Aspergillus cristatus TaxID=573508 RepID=A0A1E3B2I3_ASPCR|nr:hypothetical protein SI65_09399 [Aspergillus cristatus]